MYTHTHTHTYIHTRTHTPTLTYRHVPTDTSTLVAQAPTHNGIHLADASSQAEAYQDSQSINRAMEVRSVANQSFS